MTPQWFRFSAPDAEDQFGYGRQTEAEEYAKALGGLRVQPLGYDIDLGSHGVGFLIAEALACLKDKKDC